MKIILYVCYILPVVGEVDGIIDGILDGTAKYEHVKYVYQ